VLEEEKKSENGVSGRGVGWALGASRTQGALKKEGSEESGWIDGQAGIRLWTKRVVGHNGKEGRTRERVKGITV
jgi:hypothetical protein